MSMLRYVGHDSSECEWCDKEFEWDGDDVIETIEESHDGVQIVRWQVVCPHCEETVTVSQF